MFDGHTEKNAQFSNFIETLLVHIVKSIMLDFAIFVCVLIIMPNGS